MAKLTLNDLANLQNENTAVTTINNNSNLIETAMENTLSRDGTAPNSMGSNLDMNGWHILNLPEPSTDNDPIRRIDLVNVSQVTNVLHTTSSTSNSIGTGAKTFTVPSGLGFFPGQYLMIQDAASSANYMIGRVTSYSGSTLVFNSTVTAGSGTKTSWTIDISGAPGPVSVVYDTVLNCIGATIPGTISFLSLAGYTAVGDGGNGLYQRKVSMPSHMGRFQSADGAWWELISGDVTPEMFGCIGDGLTNDQANFQNCIDFVASRGGGRIFLTPNKIYRIVINSGVTNLGLILKDKVALILRGSRINLECTGYVMGIRPLNQTQILGPGTIAVTVATGLSGGFAGDSSIWQANIAWGNPYGLGGTVISPNTFDFVTGCVVDGVTFTNVRNNGQGALVEGFGGVSEITVQNNIFPDNSTIALAIGFDWSFLGTMDSANITACRASYDAGTAYTTHPHNLTIRNNKIGSFLMPNTGSFGSHAIRLSGCYNASITGNDIQDTTYASIFHTGGDLGFEFSPVEVRRNACRNIVIENNNIHNCREGYAVYWEAYPDNVYQAFANPANPSYPYTPIGLADGYFTDSSVKGNKLQTSGVVSSNPLMIIGFTRGLLVSDNVMDGLFNALYGIRVQTAGRFVTIEKNIISLTKNAGIYVNDNDVEKLLIKDNWVWRCSGSAALQGNIYINNSIQATIKDNYVGSFDEDQALNGIKIDTAAIFATVENNLCWEVKTGGNAFNIVNASNINTIWEFCGNRYRGSAGVAYTGQAILPYRRDYSITQPSAVITHATSQRSVMASDITPSFGTWTAGSTCTNMDAVTGQVFLTKCTATGTPGAWKAVSTVS